MIVYIVESFDIDSDVVLGVASDLPTARMIGEAHVGDDIYANRAGPWRQYGAPGEEVISLGRHAGVSIAPHRLI